MRNGSFNLRRCATLISKTAEYALRAVIHLASESVGRPTRAHEIADALDVPSNYLSKILHALARVGILTSGRGPRGGFMLAKPADELRLADLLEALDPSLLQSDCLLGEANCSDETACAVHDKWKRVRDPVCRFFRETTVAEVVDGLPGAVSAVKTDVDIVATAKRNAVAVSSRPQST
jgi:Rrf2 family protein